MEVKVLGTVSPFSRLDRNCPGFLVTVGETKILLDCGNGCLRLLDPCQDLENLHVIITHLHHDHYGDLTALAHMSFVQHNLGYLKNKINVYLPNYTDYEDLKDYKLEHLYLNKMKASFLNIIPYDDYHPISLNDRNITIKTCQTLHDVVCNAIRIDYEDQSIVYSADTGYSEGLFKEFAKDTDLFICESSFLKEQQHYNKNNNHLCAYQAALYAKEAEVKQLMLTHFYPIIDRNLYLEEARIVFPNTVLAQENMIKKIGERR